MAKPVIFVTYCLYISDHFSVATKTIVFFASIETKKVFKLNIGIYFMC